MGKCQKIVCLTFYFGSTQVYFDNLHTFNYAIQFICVNFKLGMKKTQHQTIYIEFLY